MIFYTYIGRTDKNIRHYFFMGVLISEALWFFSIYTEFYSFIIISCKSDALLPHAHLKISSKLVEAYLRYDEKSSQKCPEWSDFS